MPSCHKCPIAVPERLGGMLNKKFYYNLSSIDPDIKRGSDRDDRFRADLTSPDKEKIPCFKCRDSSDSPSNSGEDHFSIDNSLRGDGQDFENAYPRQDDTDGIPIYDLFFKNDYLELAKLKKMEDRYFVIAWRSGEFKTLKELGEHFGKKPPWVTQTMKRCIEQAPRLEKLMKKRKKLT